MTPFEWFKRNGQKEKIIVFSSSSLISTSKKMLKMYLVRVIIDYTTFDNSAIDKKILT